VSEERLRAIDTIPWYIAKCEYFVILCPPLRHAGGQTLSWMSWAERGWCRTERLARELATRNDGFIIVIESAMHQGLIFTANSMLDAPGLGKFTFPADSDRITPAIFQLVWHKLLFYLDHGDVHRYRLLLNSHKGRCFQGLDVDRIEGLVPGFQTDIDPFTDPQGFILARFMHQNGFKSCVERDARGWSPLAYAVMNGNTSLVQAVLDGKADASDALAKPEKELNLPKGMPVLAIAAVFRNNAVMRLLLSVQADVNARDITGSVPLHAACFSNNAAGVRILLEARADPNLEAFTGFSPFQLAAGCSSLDAMKEMLAQNPEQSLRYCLHSALIIQRGFTETIAFLIAAKADVDEEYRVGTTHPTWWLLLNLSASLHRVSPSRWTLLAYHHDGGTPLMFSILCGCYEATSMLLAAGARVDVRNYRRKTAADLARGMQAPSSVVQSLELPCERGVESQEFFSI